MYFAPGRLFIGQWRDFDPRLERPRREFMIRAFGPKSENARRAYRARDDELPTQTDSPAPRPLRDTHGVHFPISVQRADHEFTPRPLQSWIEVTPLANEKPAGAKYIFYDTNWEPGLPAPVENWLAEGWPRTADQAEIRAWVKFRATKPDWVVKLSHAANQLPANGMGASLDGLSGVTYQVRTRRGAEADSPYRVAVIERHTDESLGLEEREDRVVAQARPGSSIASIARIIWPHTIFRNSTTPTNNAIGNYELHFTRRENVERDALQLAEPIVRPVSDTSDVIQSR